METIQNEIMSAGTLTNLRKWYSIFLAFLPIFSIYISGLPGVNAGELLMLIFSVVLVMLKLQKKIYPINASISNFFIPLIIYLVFSSLLSILIQGESSQIRNIFVRTTRFSFYVFMIIFTSRYLLNFEIMTRWIKRIAIVATVYIIIQYLSYSIFGLLLWGHFPVLPIYSSNIYGNFTYNIRYFYRPTSFFLEPSHLVQYNIVAIILYLFNDKVALSKNLLKSIFVSASIILSTSIQGLVMLIMIWGLWFISLMGLKIKKGNVKYLIGFSILIPFIILYSLNSTVVTNTLSRLLDGNAITSSHAFIARFQGYSFFDNLSSIYKIIGLGFGSMPYQNIFLSSVVYILFGGGFLGLLFTAILFIRILLLQNSSKMRVLVIVLVVLLFATEWLYVYMAVFYLSIVCYNEKQKIIR